MTCPHCLILLDLQKHKVHGEGFRLFLACPECDYNKQLNTYSNGNNNINRKAKTV
jgi:DNA-directed RNA polymerase subunit M/transcription elongation factor TFIIS